MLATVSATLLALAASSLAAPIFLGDGPAPVLPNIRGCPIISEISTELRGQPWNVNNIAFLSRTGSICAYTGTKNNRERVIVKTEQVSGRAIAGFDGQAVRDLGLEVDFQQRTPAAYPNAGTASQRRYFSLMHYTDDYVWPQELAFWKTYVGQDAAGHGTVTIPPGNDSDVCDVFIQGMHDTIVDTVREQVRTTGWLNWAITEENMLWTFNKNGDEAHEMQFIAWDTAEQVGRRELNLSDIKRVRNIAERVFPVAQICR